LTRRFAVAVVLVLVLVAVSLLTFARAHSGNTQQDDAFILMVYIRHVLASGSIIWNQADGPVDGCTSMLDLLVKALAVAMSHGDIVRVTFWVTLFFHAILGVVGMAISFAASPHARGRWAWSFVAGLLFAASPALADGSSYLLETPLYVCVGLLLVGMLLWCRSYSAGKRALLVVLACLVTLARPEGLALASLVLVVFAVEQYSLSWSARLFTVGAFAALAAAYLVWHRSYFGYWAPNSYYAKTSALRWNEVKDGYWYIRHYLEDASGRVGLLPILVCAGAVFARGFVDRVARFRFTAVAATSVLMLLVVVVSGGDSYRGARFLGLPIALALLALVYGFLHALGRLRLLFGAVIALVSVVQLVSAFAHLPDAYARARTEWPFSQEMFWCELQSVTALQKAIPRGTVAQSDFQRLKYFADEFTVIDLHGLNDREIAHQPWTDYVGWGKYDAANGIRRHPDAWFWGYKFRLHHLSFADIPMRRLVNDADIESQVVGYAGTPFAAKPDAAAALVDQYLPATFPVCGRFINLIVRKELADNFRRAGFVVGSTD